MEAVKRLLGKNWRRYLTKTAVLYTLGAVFFLDRFNGPKITNKLEFKKFNRMSKIENQGFKTNLKLNATQI